MAQVLDVTLRLGQSERNTKESGRDEIEWMSWFRVLHRENNK